MSAAMTLDALRECIALIEEAPEEDQPRLWVALARDLDRLNDRSDCDPDRLIDCIDSDHWERCRHCGAQIHEIDAPYHGTSWVPEDLDPCSDENGYPAPHNPDWKDPTWASTTSL